jgi:hypothetical protein
VRARPTIDDGVSTATFSRAAAAGELMRQSALVAFALAALAGAASAAAPVSVIYGDRNAGGIRIARSTPADVRLRALYPRAPADGFPR